MGISKPPLCFAVVILLNALSGCVSDQTEQSVIASTNDQQLEELFLQFNESKNQSEELSLLLNESKKQLEELNQLLEDSNQSNQMHQMKIEILQISLELEKQNNILQSISYNISLEELINNNLETQQLLAEANSIISQYESIDLATYTGNQYTPLLFEDYNHSGLYMNHHNWNGGLWDRVIFDEHGIPMVQYSDGLKYVPITAFHWGLVQYSKWIETE